jgi:accessory colonization factor AcfC
MTTQHRTNKTSGVQFIAVNIDLYSEASISAAEKFINELLADGWKIHLERSGFMMYQKILVKTIQDNTE